MNDTITISYNKNVLDGLFAVLQHASKDDVTPVICTVVVTATDFIATDRYSVGMWNHEIVNHPAVRSEESTEAIMIPRDAALWLTTQLPKKVLGVADTIPEHGNTIQFSSTEISIRDANEKVLAVHVFSEIKGNFPPVAHLFPATEDLNDGVPEIRLSVDALAKLVAGHKRARRDSAESISFRFTGKNTGKLGPVLVTFGDHASRFKALLQPNLILR